MRKEGLFEVIVRAVMSLKFSAGQLPIVRDVIERVLD